MIELYRHPDGYGITYDSDALYAEADGERLRIPIGTLGLMNLALSMLQIVHVEIGGAVLSEHRNFPC